MELQRFHFIKVEALPATNTKPARVKVTSERYKQAVIINFTNDPGDINPASDSAVRWLTSNGFNVVGHGEGNGCNWLATDTFKKLK